MADKKQPSLPGRPIAQEDPVGYLLSLYAIRDQCKRVGRATVYEHELLHFEFDSQSLIDTINLVVQTIKRDYNDPDSIPPHGRWQHFEVGGVLRVDAMMRLWSPEIDSVERTRRLIDLTTVSVLLDAGAGNQWRYKAYHEGNDSKFYSRSEGLAVASLDMFKGGLFTTDPTNHCQVDAKGLASLTRDTVARGLQVSTQNPIEGLEGRVKLLRSLASALEKDSSYFGSSARPGAMIDYLLNHPTTRKDGDTTIVLVTTLWEILIKGLGPIWPSTRTKLNGQSLGDAWPYDGIVPNPEKPWTKIVPFHKLTQWLCYSIMIPVRRLLNVTFVGEHLLTGLPEYRNGGLFVDNGVLKLKANDVRRGIDNFARLPEEQRKESPYVIPYFDTHDDVIVEWRALTVSLLDDMFEQVKRKLSEEFGKDITLAQMLEAGSWKAGREVARVVRPQSGGPPIGVFSDGTVF